MVKPKYVKMTNTFLIVFTLCCCPVMVFISDILGSLASASATELKEMRPRAQPSPDTGEIVGKVLDTSGAALADITISIQALKKTTPYGSAFEDVATTDKKGKFRITNISRGTYLVRATPSSYESYLPNDDVITINSTKKPNRIRLKLSSSIPAGALYVGSEVCLGCHGEYKGWKQTAHANYIRTNITPDTVAAPFAGEIISTSDGKVKFKPFILDNIYKVTLFDLNDESVSATYTVVRTHGGAAVAGTQRYHVKIAGSHYILPVQYNLRNVEENNPHGAWVSYRPQDWYNSDQSLITTDVNVPGSNYSSEQYCEGCHVTGLNITQTSDGRFISGSQEFNVSCESCHGPGGDHVPQKLQGNPKAYIINPRYLAADRANEVCGQCHSRVKSKAGETGPAFETEYPCIVDGNRIVPFVPGKVLGDYIETTDSAGKTTAGYWDDNDSAALGANASRNNHSEQHHQQSDDFKKDTHFSVSGMRCIACHESHGNGQKGTAQLREKSENNKLCIACHDRYADTEKKHGRERNLHARHYISRSKAGGSRCTGCHMPKTAKSGADNDISSHIFDIIKPSTSRAMADINTAEGKTNNPGTVITNSCYGCHPNDTDYGVARWNRWSILFIP